MIPTSDLSAITRKCKEKYGSESKVIGIMIARYSVREVKPIVDENYRYWNEQSGKNFDVFWLGYENVCDWNPPGYLKVEGVESLFYSDEILSKNVRNLRNECGINYRDGGCTLLLVKYNGEVIDYSNCICKDLLSITNDNKRREYMNDVIEYSIAGKPIEQLSRVLPKGKVINGNVINVVSIILHGIDLIFQVINYAK